MSLVNDMLRDLDRRRRVPGPAVSRYGNDNDDDSAPVSAGKWKLVVSVGLALVIGAGAGFVYFNQGQIQSPDQQASQPVAASPVVDATAISVQAPPVQPQPLVAVITATTVNEAGLEIRIAADDMFSHEIVSRDNFGINLLLSDIERVENRASIAGFSYNISDAGVHIALELNQQTDFRVNEQRDSVDGSKSLIIRAMFVQTVQQISDVKNAPAVEAVASNSAPASPAREPDAGAAMVAADNVDNATPAASESGTQRPEASATIKRPRQLTLEEQDINRSQAAAQEIQKGQLLVAYQMLLEFIGEHPEAHRSRETLATLLFAQQEYLQAGAVVDQGLAVAPNYTGYKKIKARLLMLDNMAADAAGLLQNVPPAIAEDPEYFELLASAYQQADEHTRAIETYQQLIRYDSKMARWWTGLGISHEAQGNAEAAISSYQAALQSPGLEAALRQYSQNRIRYLRN